MSKVLVAMSGGVDSSVAAALLLEGGHEAVGVTMRLFDGGKQAESEAAAVCARLGIDFHVLDCRGEFNSGVIEPFAEAYLRGETPNPCVECNRLIKFGLLLVFADKLGCSHLATGHYARILKLGGRWRLKTAADKSKDQSYVLYHLKQAQLARILLPLGGLTKTAVREKARLLGLYSADKRESQDICFIPGGDYAAFIEGRGGFKSEPGDFLSADGQALGRHRGIIHYTIGQRRGLELPLGERVYVIGKNSQSNEVIVGKNEKLMRVEVFARRMNYIDGGPPEAPLELLGKIRYNQSPLPLTLFPLGGQRARAVFKSPQRAVAPGQSLVLYEGDFLFGGGIITGHDG